jgi:hypothetical protein
MRTKQLVASLVLSLVFVASAAAQNAFRKSQYKSLTRIVEVRLLVGRSDEKEAVALASALGLDDKNIFNIVTIDLAKSAPKIKLVSKEDIPNLVVDWYGNADGIVFSLSLWRWTTVYGTTQEIYTQVWHVERLMLNPNRQGVRDTLEDFLTEFAADAVRANQQ